MVNTLTHIERKIRHQAGITLVELLLAMTILGLAASVVILNAPPAGQTAKREATRFAARLKAASDEAILSGDAIGLDISTQNYRFFRLQDGTWAELESRIFAPWELENDIVLSKLPLERGQPNLAEGLAENDKIIKGRGSSLFASTADEKDKDSDAEDFIPDIQFRSINADTPFTALFSDRSQEWAVNHQSNGTITITRIDRRVR